MMQAIKIWTCAVLREWYWWVGGTFVSVAFLFFQAKNWTPPSQFYLWSIPAGLLVSSFIAWQKQYDAKKLLEEKVKEIKGPQLILSVEWPREVLTGPSPDTTPMRFVSPLNQSVERPFIISNESDLTAHNVKIRDLERSGLIAMFDPIGFVRKGDDKPSLPYIEKMGPFNSRSLRPLFADDEDGLLVEGKRPTMETEVSVIIDYEDMRGAKWETAYTMFYDLIWHTARFTLKYYGPRRSSI